MTPEISPVVIAIGRIHMEGNIVPHAWFEHPAMRHESGTINLVAILLLSDIVYWYRPITVRDEETGTLLPPKQKFARDMLQRSYDSWARQFGLSKRQCQDAITFLVARGILRRELRTVTLAGGMTMNNVLFVEPLPRAIAILCSGGVLPWEAANGSDRASAKETPITLERDRGHDTKRPLSPPTGRRSTETSAETSADIVFPEGDGASPHTPLSSGGSRGTPPLASHAKPKQKWCPPTVEEIATRMRRFCVEYPKYAVACPDPDADAIAMITHYTSNGWRVGSNPMKDWQSSACQWVIRNFKKMQEAGKIPAPGHGQSPSFISGHVVAPKQMTGAEYLRQHKESQDHAH